MSAPDPQAKLHTHEVVNQVPLLGDVDLTASDTALTEALRREAPPWVESYAAELGLELGREEVRRWGFEANRHVPELRAFDERGRRIDEVDYHPAYHALMRTAIERGAHAVAWEREGEGGAVAHAAAMYLLTQPEQGFCCPITMTHAVIPALRHEPALAETWEPRVLARSYDPRLVPAEEKSGATFGMAMTEKQGGSDVRANTTRAEPLGARGEYVLTGHKWFCSAPMSDAFLVLAQAPGGLTCFLVPRFTPEGRRNPFMIQRLKDKCGNRANASSEIEFDATWAHRVGEEGRGVRTILEMVHQTRLDAATAPVGMMRWALVQAIHHAEHRVAFGRRLLEQPLMHALLADLALECESLTTLVFRVARSFDASKSDPRERAIARIATALAKYHTNKRAPVFLAEAMESLGGVGYVEESVLPRLYREAPVNGIWEGSGNVICLDVLRAMDRESEALDALLGEIDVARGQEARLDGLRARIDGLLGSREKLERHARQLVESLALALTGSLLIRYAPSEVASAYCKTRLGDAPFRGFTGVADERLAQRLLDRAWPGS